MRVFRRACVLPRPRPPSVFSPGLLCQMECQQSLIPGLAINPPSDNVNIPASQRHWAQKQIIVPRSLSCGAGIYHLGNRPDSRRAQYFWARIVEIWAFRPKAYVHICGGPCDVWPTALSMRPGRPAACGNSRHFFGRMGAKRFILPVCGRRGGGLMGYAECPGEPLF